MASKFIALKNIVSKPKFCRNRHLSLSPRINANVSVIGAGGGIGQPLSLLLKYNPLINLLNLYDVTDVEGLKLDLSHIDTPSKIVPSLKGDLIEALEHADIVVVPAGFPRKPGMSRDDLFEANAKIILDVIIALRKMNTMPLLAIITNPINSIIPFAYHLMNLSAGTSFDETLTAKEMILKNRLFGVSTLDCVRAASFYAEYLNVDPNTVVVPVVGGHSDTTMVPLFSKSNIPLTDTRVAIELTKRVREAGTKVVEAKKGKGSATLSMAYSANRFVHSLLVAFHGQNVQECAYIHSPAHKDLTFFAETAKITMEGVDSVFQLENLSDFECQLLSEIIEPLKSDIKKGEDYAKKCEEMVLNIEPTVSEVLRNS